MRWLATFFINGETMVQVKSNGLSSISNLTQLGLSDMPIRVSLDFKHLDIKVDAWGQMPPEIQFMLAGAVVSMTLVHFDRSVLDECWRLSMGGASAVGTLPRAGSRMGNAFSPVGANANNFIQLSLTSQVGNKPWRFLTAYLASPPADFPLGTERSVVSVQWRVIPYPNGAVPGDPWNNGSGASGTVLWDYVAAT